MIYSAAATFLVFCNVVISQNSNTKGEKLPNIHISCTLQQAAAVYIYSWGLMNEQLLNELERMTRLILIMACIVGVIGYFLE